MVSGRDMKRLLLSLALFVAIAPVRAAEDSEEGVKTIIDGKTFNGWKVTKENPNSWKIEDGSFVAKGERAHLFYVGDETPFKDFELKVDVMTEPGSNGG